MTKDMKDWIEDLTSIIRKEYDVQSPVDFKSLIEDLGGEIKEIDDGACEEAVILKKSEDSFLINLQEHKPDRRKRFSIAHELGHLFIHMGYLWNDEKWESFKVGEGFPRLGDSEQEREAHYFAAAFLMPDDEFREQCENASETIDGKNVCHLNTVADYFEVSYDAALNRGRNLGLFAW